MSARPVVTIINYGVGNQASVLFTFRRIGYRARITRDPDLVAGADVLVLPGVGAFPPAMAALRASGLGDIVVDRARAGVPTIGLCLGMQLLATASMEFGRTEGLNLIPGTVVPLPNTAPHIGWNTLEPATANHDFLQPFFGQAFYFNHTYIFEGEPARCWAHAHHPAPLAAVIGLDNVVGLQFHPEKSQEAGGLLLQNLVGVLSDA